MLTNKVTRSLIDLANDRNIKVIVDPKGNDYLKYKGAFLLTPNKKEAAEITNIHIKDNKTLLDAAKKIKTELKLNISLITMSEQGIAIFDNELRVKPTVTREVFDVTGAGDTVLSSLGYALALNTKPILGCIAHPPSEIIWVGGSEIGSYKKNSKDDFVEINCRDVPEEGPTIAISKHHIGPKLEKWLSSINFINKLKVGSAIKFTLIAEGKADIFPRTSPTYEWDSAAGEAIIQGSGGQVTQMNGENMIYGREDKKNPNFIAFGRPNWEKFIKGNNSG